MNPWAKFQSLLVYEIDGNSLVQWGLAAAVAAVVLVALVLLKVLLAGRIHALAQRLQSGWAPAVIQALASTRAWFLLVLAIHAGSLALVLPPKVAAVLASLTIIALLVQGAIWIQTLLNRLVQSEVRRRLDTDAASATTITSLGFLGQIVLWSVVLLLALQNLGINVTALVAGLGIGGVAVALAAQNVLADLFASLAMILDKPFVLGDTIAVGDDIGTVERIGIKTTRLRALSGEELIYGNADLLKNRIRNLKRMTERRVQFTIGVTYDTPPDQLAAIPPLLRTAVEAQPQTRFDRAHFKDFADAALNFEIVYFVLSPDFNLYMDIQQAINLAILRKFVELDIDLAYPTHTVHVRPAAGDVPSGGPASGSPGS
ncbi:MAG: mechanosensitive ion channel family protein [Pirellulaceae bacterium]|nr:mechanosensitive ion channel family protein [Pirellulaceae bacterium]